MLVSEIATRVKRQFGDEAGAQITDADIIRWVNDAQREIAVNNDLLQTLSTTPVTIGDFEYTLPPDVLTLRNVYVGTKQIRGISTQEANEAQAREGSASTGEPTHFWVWANKINLHPSPVATSTLKLYYTKQPTVVTLVGETPELPQQYHNRIVEYCIAQAHELDDDTESYQAKMKMFQDGVEKLKGQEDWPLQDVYPSITVAAADYGDGYGDW